MTHKEELEIELLETQIARLKQGGFCRGPLLTKEQVEEQVARQNEINRKFYNFLKGFFKWGIFFIFIIFLPLTFIIFNDAGTAGRIAQGTFSVMNIIPVLLWLLMWFLIYLVKEYRKI
jgi:hypothetical protein